MRGSRVILFSFFAIAFLSFSPSHAFAWMIDSFQSDIHVQEDGRVGIKEKIAVDFTGEEKHGIYRDIPVVYEARNGEKTYTKIDVGEVLQDGRKATIENTRSDEYLRIRIGDSDKTLNGKHSYVIKYIATGVLKAFNDYDELYWNVTGNYWDAPIISASATVTLSRDAITRITCFQGAAGQTEACDSKQVNTRQANFDAARPLQTSEGLTIVVGYTHGIMPILTVAPPKKIEQEIFALPSLLSFVIALVLGVAGMVMLWHTYGRDFWYRVRRVLDPNAKEEPLPIGAHGPVVVEFVPPEKLRPAEIGVLMDEKADTLDVTATIIDLATRGFLTITEVSKKWLFGSTDYALTQKNTSKTDLLPYEKLLLDKLFAGGGEVAVSSLKTTFYDELKEVKGQLYKDVMEKKLFLENPESVRIKYLVISFIVMAFGGLLIFLGAKVIIGPIVTFGVGMIITGLLLMFFLKTMPRRTAAGRELFERGKGYELFIGGAEKYRQQFFEKKNLFNEILPYAIVFGLTEKFAKAMEKMGVKPTTTGWYYGAHPFNIVSFGRSVNAFSSSMSQAIASTPSKSGGFGGGSSGGGFGGGGGGSW